MWVILLVWAPFFLLPIKRYLLLCCKLHLRGTVTYVKHCVILIATYLYHNLS